VGAVSWVLDSTVSLSLVFGCFVSDSVSRMSPCLKKYWSCSGPFPWSICAAAKASPSPVSNVLVVTLSVVWTMVGSLVGLVMGQPLIPPGAGAPPVGAVCEFWDVFPNFSAFMIAPFPLRRSPSGVLCANRHRVPYGQSPSM
jgi:hypothetical protein